MGQDQPDWTVSTNIEAGSVTISAGTVDLAPTTKVVTAAGSVMAIPAAEPVGSTPSKFSVRTLSTTSTASGTAGSPGTYVSIIPAVGPTTALTLQAIQNSASATATVTLSTTPSSAGKFAVLTGGTFTFQGSTLPKGTGVYATGGNAIHIQINYLIR